MRVCSVHPRKCVFLRCACQLSNLRHLHSSKPTNYRCTDVDTETVEGTKASRWPRLLIEITWRDRLRIRQRLKRDMSVYQNFWQEFGQKFTQVWTSVWPIGFKRKLLRVTKTELHMWMKYALEEEAALAEEQRKDGQENTIESLNPDTAYLFATSSLAMWTNVLEQIGYFCTPKDKVQIFERSVEGPVKPEEAKSTLKGDLTEVASTQFPKPIFRMARPRVIDAPKVAEYPSESAALPERIFETSLVFIPPEDEDYFPMKKPDLSSDPTAPTNTGASSNESEDVGYFTVHEGFLREPKAFLARAFSTSRPPLLPKAKRERNRSFAELLGRDWLRGRDAESKIAAQKQDGYEPDSESESEDDEDTKQTKKKGAEITSVEEKANDAEDYGLDEPEPEPVGQATTKDAKLTHRQLSVLAAAEPTASKEPTPQTGDAESTEAASSPTTSNMINNLIKPPLALSAKPIYSTSFKDYSHIATGKGQASQSFRADRRLLRTIIFRLMLDKVIDAFLEAEESSFGEDADGPHE